ncbi:hypothetical protein AB0F71_10450 [Kitasatospora sp. NPDC028055]|uniref:hypothetical protein n=1 Tax=Kitasatospora sp. NPDC028055 TaxID=3155653 RepID=UPI0033D2213E
MEQEHPVNESPGPLTAFDGRIVLDLTTRIATVDGREVPLTHQDTRALRALIELGEGMHDLLDIQQHGWDGLFDPRELRHPMAVLRAKLGEPPWIVREQEHEQDREWNRDRDRYGLRPPGPPPSGKLRA